MIRLERSGRGTFFDAILRASPSYLGLAAHDRVEFSAYGGPGQVIAVGLYKSLLVGASRSGAGGRSGAVAGRFLGSAVGSRHHGLLHHFPQFLGKLVKGNAAVFKRRGAGAVPLHEYLGHELGGRCGGAVHALACEQDLLRLVTQRNGAPLAEWNGRRRGDLVFNLFFYLPDVDTQTLENPDRIRIAVTQDSEENMVGCGYVTAQPCSLFQRIVEHYLDLIGIIALHHRFLHFRVPR